ncbi:hypothetical protein J2W28_006696 [Variovorax boronicumulans]|uniref:hypothetical protein n=1 Tax=Variovorax boronicumulans TaxID=436515 RepID=UPI0027830956|nr:hypothetical protein [Variovorax boronicumulans]MDP9996318.1 hypothetical protein [Variovorax boronicumulans]MDQ0007517.1 hypothetical protein [Variovorax boronicumulans]
MQISSSGRQGRSMGVSTEYEAAWSSRSSDDDTVPCRFNLHFQTGEKYRAAFPVSALFRVASRSEVNHWLLESSPSFRTDRDLVLRYTIDLRRENGSRLRLEDIVEDARAAAMIAAVFLQNLRD